MLYLSNNDVIKIIFSSIFESLIILFFFFINIYFINGISENLNSYVSNITGLPLSYNLIILFIILEFFLYKSIKNHFNNWHF